MDHANTLQTGDPGLTSGTPWFQHHWEYPAPPNRTAEYGLETKLTNKSPETEQELNLHRKRSGDRWWSVTTIYTVPHDHSAIASICTQDTAAETKKHLRVTSSLKASMSNQSLHRLRGHSPNHHNKLHISGLPRAAQYSLHRCPLGRNTLKKVDFPGGWEWWRCHWVIYFLWKGGGRPNKFGSLCLNDPTPLGNVSLVLNKDTIERTLFSLKYMTCIEWREMRMRESVSEWETKDLCAYLRMEDSGSTPNPAHSSPCSSSVIPEQRGSIKPWALLVCHKSISHQRGGEKRQEKERKW